MFWLDAKLSFSQSVFTVKENEGPAQPELFLSTPVPVSFTVIVYSDNIDLAGELWLKECCITACIKKLMMHVCIYVCINRLVYLHNLFNCIHTYVYGN